MKKLLIVTIVFSCCYSVVAQEEMDFEKNSVSLNGGGSTAVIGATYERLFGDHIMGEVGLGLISYGGGVTYYPGGFESGKAKFYTGAKSTFFTFPLAGVIELRILYLPIGITYFSNARINLGADAGLAQFRVKSGSDGIDPDIDRSLQFYINLKLGFRFQSMPASERRVSNATWVAL